MLREAQAKCYQAAAAAVAAKSQAANMTLSPANATSNDSWWSRPSGGRDVLRVAAPMVVSSLSWTIMTFVDRMFLNWVSPTLMAGAFSAGVSWFMLICLPLGVCSYANTFVAQHDGARPHEQIGR